ncbi:MAG: acetyl-CoA carboxylase biotin carboxyl carrier protein subunit [Chloroflexi bacterium]|nr:acetyl-CoA carboxylase biotin carboxyl carrier protein subunit [Chloroflexota bacterium]
MKYYTKVNEKEYIIEIGQDDEIVVNDKQYAIDFRRLAQGGTVSLLLNNRSLEAVVDERDDHWEVLTEGELYNVSVQDERAYRLAQARGTGLDMGHEAVVKAPMPGLIIRVLVAEGDTVERNEKVVILESMKMENELRAPREGLVTAVHVSAGSSVEKDQVLIVIGDLEA